MKKNGKYCGVVVPMVTPVTEKGDIDVEAVARIVKSFVDAGVSPLLMGTTGEGNSVSLEQGRVLVEATVKTAEGKVTVYAGLTGTCVADQIQQAKDYAALKADVIVATLPGYYALTEQQMVDYYTNIADNCPLPFMLYNIKATTHMSIPVDVIRQLSRHPNIVGLKDSERDLDRMDQCVGISKGNPDFSYFCGWAAQSAHCIEIGGDGFVPSTGNFVPGMFAELYDAAVAGDMDTANRLQDETNQIAKIYQEGRLLGQSLAALKVMMHTHGLCTPEMLPPLTRLDEAEEKEIAGKAAMITYNAITR